MVERLFLVRRVVGSILHDESIELFHWFNKKCGMCYLDCEMVHINDPLLLIEKSSPCRSAAGFLSLVTVQPVLHDWCNKGRGMCYPVCGMVHIKEPLLLIDKSSLCGFPISLSEWSLTIRLTPYNR